MRIKYLYTLVQADKQYQKTIIIMSVPFSCIIGEKNYDAKIVENGNTVNRSQRIFKSFWHEKEDCC